jgi:hypothetical protein
VGDEGAHLVFCCYRQCLSLIVFGGRGMGGRPISPPLSTISFSRTDSRCLGLQEHRVYCRGLQLFREVFAVNITI